MLSITATTPVYPYSQPADMRKSFDGLSGLVADASADDGELLSGGLFVFHNKRRDRLKILYFDHDGLALWYKRLEKGTFAFPSCAEGNPRLAVKPADLRLILDGVDLASVKKRRRYQAPAPKLNLTITQADVTDDRRTAGIV